MQTSWDVFISHASEDKATVARPLADILRRSGIRVWLDESELTLGDSLSRRIDEGLARSNFGVVILSKEFFEKGWPTHELSGLMARQIGGKKVILPVWHGVDRNLVLSYSPPLADALSVNTKLGLERVAEEILRAVRSSAEAPLPTPVPPARRRKRIQFGALAALAILSAGVFYSLSLRKPPPREDDSSRPLFWRMNHGPISGYLSVTCNTCSRPRAWAFYVSSSKDGAPSDPPELAEGRRNTVAWPTTEFLYPDDKPGIASCIDYPLGVCRNSNWIWTPKNNGARTASKAGGPALRLVLEDVISGFQIHILNEGSLLAQGINVDAIAWQVGAPGPELIKNISVRDLGPLADVTIQSPFGVLPQ